MFLLYSQFCSSAICPQKIFVTQARDDQIDNFPSFEFHFGSATFVWRAKGYMLLGTQKTCKNMARYINKGSTFVAWKGPWSRGDSKPTEVEAQVFKLLPQVLMAYGIIWPATIWEEIRYRKKANTWCYAFFTSHRSMLGGSFMLDHAIIFDREEHKTLGKQNLRDGTKGIDMESGMVQCHERTVVPCNSHQEWLQLFCAKRGLRVCQHKSLQVLQHVVIMENYQWGSNKQCKSMVSLKDLHLIAFWLVI